MAIDTTEKKLSLFDLGLPFRRTLPTGDGSFDTGDKQHFLFLYSGISASDAADALPNQIAPLERRNHIIGLPDRPHIIGLPKRKHFVKIPRD